jgi:hypothetical protein
MIISCPDGNSFVNHAIFGFVVSLDCRYYWGTPIFTVYGVHKLGGATSSVADLTVVVS